MSDLNNAQSKVVQLFDLTGIQRVICVDDYYEISVDTVRQICFGFSDRLDVLISLDKFKDFPFTPYPDEWSSQFTQLLTELPEEDLQQIYEQLYISQPDKEWNSPTPIATLLSSRPFEGISPSKWRKSSEEFLEAGKDGTILFLFDQNLGDGYEEGGMRIIQQICNADGENRIICGLLSSTFSPEEEYEQWLELAEKYKVSRDRFLLISKRHVTPESSAGMIKLIVLNRFCEALKFQVRDVLKAAQEQAHTKINEINVYDFEHMVFRTSSNEGIWEPDTLIRLFSIFQRHEVLRLARETPDIPAIANKIRQTIDIDLINKSTKTRFARTVMHLERFEANNYLVEHHVPLDLGDIFEITKNETTKLYILLAQPCDLMVRSNGKRSGINEGIFVRVDKKSNEFKLSELKYYNLYYFTPETEEEYFVDFRRPITINLNILDLCVFDELGRTRIVLDDEPPVGLIPSWNARYGRLREYFKKSVTKLQKYLNVLDKDAHDFLLPCASQERQFKPAFILAPLSIDYGFKRIGRLRQPAAGELLSLFANYNARAAFDHELDREIDNN
jgi:hypothetical protein